MGSLFVAPYFNLCESQRSHEEMRRHCTPLLIYQNLQDIATYRVDALIIGIPMIWILCRDGALDSFWSFADRMLL